MLNSVVEECDSVLNVIGEFFIKFPKSMVLLEELDKGRGRTNALSRRLRGVK